jgi:hypothetical protein
MIYKNCPCLSSGFQGLTEYRVTEYNDLIILNKNTLGNPLFLVFILNFEKKQ